MLTNIASQFDNSDASVSEKIKKAFDTTKELSAVPDLLTAMQKNALDLMVNLVGRNCEETSETEGLSHILLSHTVSFIKALLLNLLYSFDPNQEFPKMLRNTGLQQQLQKVDSAFTKSVN